MHLEFMLLDLFCLCVQKMRDLMLALSALNFASYCYFNFRP